MAVSESDDTLEGVGPDDIEAHELPLSETDAVPDADALFECVKDGEEQCDAREETLTPPVLLPVSVTDTHGDGVGDNGDDGEGALDVVGDSVAVVIDERDTVLVAHGLDSSDADGTRDAVACDEREREADGVAVCVEVRERVRAGDCDELVLTLCEVPSLGEGVCVDAREIVKLAL